MTGVYTDMNPRKNSHLAHVLNCIIGHRAKHINGSLYVPDYGRWAYAETAAKELLARKYVTPDGRLTPAGSTWLRGGR